MEIKSILIKDVAAWYKWVQNCRKWKATFRPTQPILPSLVVWTEEELENYHEIRWADWSESGLKSIILAMSTVETLKLDPSAANKRVFNVHMTITVSPEKAITTSDIRDWCEKLIPDVAANLASISVSYVADVTNSHVAGGGGGACDPLGPANGVGEGFSSKPIPLPKTATRATSLIPDGKESNL